LLIKFIDANQDHSKQVHPDDILANERHNSFGKTEMWYVIDAELLNRESVAADDVIFLPAGRVHTIGKGLLIAEIQQTSDITYRINDFDRRDKNGHLREFHTEGAIDAIDYNFYNDYKTCYDKLAENTELVASEYFITNRLLVSKSTVQSYDNLDSFKILMVLEGSGSIDTSDGSYGYKTGDSYLIPACLDALSISPEEESKILEVYLPS
jgi:mannose-6-phosphate isomerase